ncbi:Hvo_1808 family surface protein [Halostagnicola bangensis]
MNPTRTRVLGVVLVLSIVSLLVVVAGVGFPLLSIGDGPTQDWPDDPSTEDTVGYVEGYWYDDELSVDESDDATVADDDLDGVISRSMARVETIRGLTFQDEVSVDVISREEFQAQDDAMVTDPDADERLHENVRLEALFMADRQTDAIGEHEALYDGSVAGYYDPETDEIVIVSDNSDEPELNEITLGHELLHALQDQHFDLTSYDRETQDQDNAKNGLIEGDAVWVETEYEERCEDEWACTLPSTDSPEEPPAINWGLYLTTFFPYDDGPGYVDSILEGDRQGDDAYDWDALDATYDDPPASTSEVIRPGEDREPRDIEIEDRSSENWSQHEVDGERANDSVGEATLVAMFAADGLDGGESVIGVGELLPDGPFGEIAGIEYDHDYTDGWAGDELVTYVGENDSVEDSGYVWQTEWDSENDAEQFLDGYLELLNIHDADEVDDHRDTFEIDDETGYPGAYFVDHDGESVTVVRAPSVSELSELDADAAPAGEDTLELDANATDAGAENESDADDSDEIETTSAEPIPGFGVPIGLAALLVGALAARVSR